MGGETTGRRDGRAPDELRPCSLIRGVLKYPEGSALIVLGDTRVLVTASVEERVPPFLKGTGRGWITAEYAMLPRATPERNPREISRPAGRTQEIQRLIGRSLRAVTDLDRLGERTVWVDCDVLQADGGTRTASITAGCVALVETLSRLRQEGKLEEWPLRDFVGAVSAGLVGGSPMLDLAYEEDSRAGVDLNVVLTGRGELVEVQGTGEGGPFSFERLEELVRLARRGVQALVQAQRQALAGLPGAREFLGEGD
ncbi:MAG: ribonuclease PH [bacterium]|nr:ribonuclease PH [bacterium]